MFKLLFFILPACWAYTHDYKAFNDCGFGGWKCDVENGDEARVRYRCDQTSDKNARVWIWTARIPSTTTVLTVENCDYVEVHPDCTTGFRAYNLKTFRAVNISTLEILKPLRPYVFLHDNDQVEHMPPKLELQNVGTVKIYPEVFNKAAGRCRVKSQFEEFIAINVTFDNLPAVDFKNQTLKLFSLDRVHLGAQPKKTFRLSANVSISNSHFERLAPNMEFQGERMTFIGNNFIYIGEGAFNIRCNNFTFKENIITMLVAKNAFNVLAQNSLISSNTFNDIHTDAFALMAPGFGTTVVVYSKAQPFTFAFIENEVQSMEKLALHPNYEVYLMVCSSIVVTKNRLPCECPKSPWSPTLANKTVLPFYQQIATYENNNTCRENLQCNLAHVEVLETEHGVCNASKDIPCDNTTLHLLFPPSTTEEPTTRPTPKTTENSPTTIKPNSSSQQTIKSEVKSIQTGSLTKNTSFIVLTLTASLIVGVFMSGLIYWIRRRRNKKTISIEAIYQNQCQSNSDIQQLINEG